MLLARFLCALSVSLLCACNQAPDRPDKDAPPPPRPKAVTPSSSGSGATDPEPRPSSSAPASASASAPGVLTGTWEGRYDAKKGAIELPAKVKDKARAADDGKAMAGPGKVELTVLPNGEIRGKASGSLGEATLSGKVDVDGGVVRASWFPADPTAPNAMTGVLIGLLKGAEIHAQIRVAGPDATLVRESEIDLKRR
jgi:hypothetical protein